MPADEIENYYIRRLSSVYRGGGSDGVQNEQRSSAHESNVKVSRELSVGGPEYFGYGTLGEAMTEAFTAGGVIFEGDTIYCAAERLTDGNAAFLGYAGFKLIFSDGSQLVLKENNGGTGEWELYMWFEDDTVCQLYNASGYRAEESYVFDRELTIAGIEFFGASCESG